MTRPRKISASFNRARRSQRLLYDWLREHHDDFSVELERNRVRDRWKFAMQVIAEHKLLDGRGNPPSRETAIDTWKRVCQDVAIERARKQAPAAPKLVLKPDEIAPGVRAVQAKEVAVPDPATALSRMTLDIRPARPLSNLPATAPAELAAAVQPGRQADAEEQIRRALEAMDAGCTPMPRVIR